MARSLPRPFLKWAGGKGRMLGPIVARIPEELGTYYEPFLGGGSLFFELSRQRRFRRAVLNDVNPELMNAYRTVKGSVEELVRCLSGDGYEYSRENYLRVRAVDPATLSEADRAARFLYLNRTCFNGLYRVNRKGRFNVPFGKYANPTICDSENLRAVASSLKKARLTEADFEKAVKGARPGDFVYFDPPYFPLSETSSFTAYTEDGFGLKEHTRLACLFSDLASKGVSVALSNSWCDTTRRLYRDFEIVELVGGRNVGGPADYRKPVREMLVVANCRGVTSAHEETEGSDSRLRVPVHAADSPPDP